MATAHPGPSASGPGSTDAGSSAVGDGRGGRPAGRGREALVVLAVFLVLGVLGGLLWAWVVTPADYTKVAGGGGMGETEFAKQFGADGWFAVIGVVAGLVAGLVLVVRRTRDPLLVVGLLVVGACLASAVMALLGHLLGPGDPGAALRAARLGARVPERLDVGPQLPGQSRQGDFPVYLSWPFGALVGALLVLLGRPARYPDDVPPAAAGTDGTAVRGPDAGTGDVVGRDDRSGRQGPPEG